MWTSFMKDVFAAVNMAVVTSWACGDTIGIWTDQRQHLICIHMALLFLSHPKHGNRSPHITKV